MDRPVSVAATSGGALIGAPGLEARLTRRRLLQGGGAAFAALAIGEGIGFARRAVGVPRGVGLRRSDYGPYVGRLFRLTSLDGRSLSIPLAAVEDVHVPGQMAGSEDAFVLVFHAPPGSPALGQAVMTVRHPRGWSQRLLVSPAGTGRRGLDYATVINSARPNRGGKHG